MSWATKAKAMTSNYEIVRYQPDFKKQVAELQTHLWSPSIALNTAYFEWKYEHNPYLKTPLVYLALHEGRAVGMRGYSGVQWEGGSPPRKFTGLYADDMVIDPAHRNSGLMTRIMTAAFGELEERGHDYVFNLSAGPLMLVSCLYMGWRNAGPMKPMRWRSWPAACQDGLQRIVERLPVLSRDVDSRFSRWAAKLRGSLADIGQDRIRRALKTVPWITFQDVPRCADMAELVGRIGCSGRIRHVRDSEYFNWRFQNPLSRYRFLFWEKDRLEGYLVLQEYTSESANHEAANIVDWEASNDVVRAELLRAAINIAGTGSLIVWSATLPAETIQLLQQNGFEHSKLPPGMARQCPAVLVRRIKKQADGDWQFAGLQLADLKNWDLRMLYSMCG